MNKIKDLQKLTLAAARLSMAAGDIIHDPENLEGGYFYSKRNLETALQLITEYMEVNQE